MLFIHPTELLSSNMITAGAVHWLNTQIPLDSVNDTYKPVLAVKDIQWKGSTGRTCHYVIIVTDGENEAPIGFTTVSPYRSKLYSLVRGKKKRLRIGSIIQLKEFIVVPTGPFGRPTGRLILARVISIVRK